MATVTNLIADLRLLSSYKDLLRTIEIKIFLIKQYEHIGYDIIDMRLVDFSEILHV